MCTFSLDLSNSKLATSPALTPSNSQAGAVTTSALDRATHDDESRLDGDYAVKGVKVALLGAALGGLWVLAPKAAMMTSLLSAVPATDPDAPRARIELDSALVNREAPLRQISEGHFAAV